MSDQKKLVHSQRYEILHEYETVWLSFHGRAPVVIGDFYGDPSVAIIDADEKWCSVAGSAVESFYYYQSGSPQPMSSLVGFRHLQMHRGSGRFATLGVGRISELLPPTAGTRFVLVCVEDAQISSLSPEHARSWVDAGATYICAWGSAAEQIEESFDYSVIYPHVDPGWTLMTSSHNHDTLDDALWYAFYTAFMPDDLPGTLDHVVIVASTQELADRCERWVAQSMG